MEKSIFVSTRKLLQYLNTANMIFLPEHAEVFPIDIKLDYKPRRVDYRALREGKTIELMNFFHFDGSEMTLRHITLSGVSGSRPGNATWTDFLCRLLVGRGSLTC